MLILMILMMLVGSIDAAAAFIVVTKGVMTIHLTKMMMIIV